MDELLLILFRGTGIGAVYALIALSLNVVYRASGILNFAQGNLFLLGGLIAVMALPSIAAPTWPFYVVLAGIALAALLVMQGWITLIPLKSSVDQHSWLITTLAASIVISAIILLSLGSAQLTAPNSFGSFRLFGMRTPWPYAMVTLLAVIWLLALRWFHSRTMVGLAMSAMAQDLDAARAAGIRTRRLQLYAFAISGLIVGSAGYVAAPIIAVANDAGIAYVLNGFVALVVGGLGSNVGALVGGIVVGVASVYAGFEYGGEFQNSVSLALLVAVLMVRPQGLFGRPGARRV
jgi:branched-chain amino acid transport system permease protein